MISLFYDRKTAVYFESFGIKYIPLEVLKKSDVNQLLKIYLEYKMMNLLCLGFYCIAFIEYILTRKSLLGYTNLFSPNDYKKNDNIIYKYFKNKYGRRSKSWV